MKLAFQEEAAKAQDLLMTSLSELAERKTPAALRNCGCSD